MQYLILSDVVSPTCGFSVNKASVVTVVNPYVSCHVNLWQGRRADDMRRTCTCGLHTSCSVVCAGVFVSCRTTYVPSTDVVPPGRPPGVRQAPYAEHSVMSFTEYCVSRIATYFPTGTETSMYNYVTYCKVSRPLQGLTYQTLYNWYNSTTYRPHLCFAIPSRLTPMALNSKDREVSDVGGVQLPACRFAIPLVSCLHGILNERPSFRNKRNHEDRHLCCSRRFGRRLCSSKCEQVLHCHQWRYGRLEGSC